LVRLLIFRFTYAAVVAPVLPICATVIALVALSICATVVAPCLLASVVVPASLGVALGIFSCRSSALFPFLGGYTVRSFLRETWSPALDDVLLLLEFVR